MDFEWDEEKNAINQEKHNIPFKVAVILFKDNKALTKRSQIDGTDAERYLRISMLDGKLVTTVFTYRGESVRIISIRRARDAEEREYSQLHN